MISGLDTTNFWLGVIAIVSVLEFLALVAAVWLAYRLYMRSMTILQELEVRHVAPLTARATRILDEVQQITGRVRDAEDVMRDGIRKVADTGIYAVTAMKARSWPIIGLARGLRAGLEAIFDRHAADRFRTGPRAAEEDAFRGGRDTTDARAAL